VLVVTPSAELVAQLIAEVDRLWPPSSSALPSAVHAVGGGEGVEELLRLNEAPIVVSVVTA
jgi:hypothetical protein